MIKDKKKPNYQRSKYIIKKKIFRGKVEIRKRLIRETFNLCKISYMEKYILDTQFKLATAIRQNNLNSIKSISHELLNSYEARCFSVYKTIKSSGYRSPGLNDKRPKYNSDYNKLVDKLGEIVNNPSTYKASPLRRIYIEKPNGGKRPTSIPTYFDRALQTLYSLILLPFGESHADQFSYGGRPMRCPANAAKTILLLGNQNKPNTRIPFYVLNANIAKCFDKISHDWIMENVPLIHPPVLKEWLKCGFIDLEGENNELNRTDEGVPQGGTISPLICNIVLNGIQRFVEDFVKNQLGNNTRCHLIRFMDDIIVLCDTWEAANIAMQAVEIFINPRGLSLNKDKTKIVDLSRKDQSYIFIGIEFSYKLIHGKYKLKLSVPSEKVSSICKRILSLCKKANSPEKIIKGTNALTIGWSNYYKICNNKYIFGKLTYWLLVTISKALYLLYIKPSFENGRFGIRKGKRSGRLRRKIAAQVVKRLHFLKAKNRGSYNFTRLRYNSVRSSIVLSKTAKRKVELFLPSYQEMREQPTTSGKDYFKYEDHLELREAAFQNKSSICAHLLKKCRGYCPSCSRDLMNCKYDIHHIKPISLGGNDSIRNLVPLCVYCHNRITIAVKMKNTKSINEFISQGLLNLE